MRQLRALPILYAGTAVSFAVTEQRRAMRIRSAGEILVLHRVYCDPIEPGPYADMAISSDALELRLSAAASRTRGSWEQILNGAVNDGWILLTFDDGYRDTLEVALPLLERYEMPAIIFLTVGFVSGELEPFSAYAARMMSGASTFQLGMERFDLSSQAGFDRAWRRASRKLDRGSLRTRFDRLRAQIEENSLRAPLPNPSVFLDWAEVRELARHPLITIGAHSWTHPRLTRIAPWLLKQELYEARNTLKGKLKSDVPLLAYPHGAHNAIVRTVARAAGYRFGFTTEPCPLRRHARLNPMAIPRVSLA